MNELWASPSLGGGYAVAFLASGECVPNVPGFLFGVIVPDAPVNSVYSSLALVNGASGSIDWTYTPGPSTYVLGFDHPWANFPVRFTDINGDGRDEILFMTSDLRVHCFTFAGATSTLTPGAPPTVGAGAGNGFRVGPSTPNPTSGEVRFALTVPGPGPVDINVFDVSGRIVRTVHEVADKAGDMTLRWDGKDEDGHAVASGAYYYRVKTNAGETTRSVIWVR